MYKYTVNKFTNILLKFLLIKNENKNVLSLHCKAI